MAKKKVAKRVAAKPAKISAPPVKSTDTMAIVALILNLILPGVGSIIGGKKKEGTIQLIIAIGAIVLFWVPLINIIAWFAWIGAWVWALIISIQIMKEAGIIK